MDLFELQAKLKLDDSSFNKGIGSATAAGEKLKNSISASTIAVGNLAADMVKKGVAAISEVIGGAIDGYADYQQLVGGVETLFGDSADQVIAHAQESYKNAGISANEYLSTVTSFSASLMQGLEGDTDKAVELANLAIQDMSDNANKMGTDIGSIQNAYQGFAKGNFTMLDNLKLGYGGTREEMVRLMNDSGVLEDKIDDLDDVTFDQMIEAIHAVQTNMGITGTTAEEAEKTISGSASRMKASWNDLLTTVAGDGQDGLNLDKALGNFTESFSVYMDNWIPTFQKTLENSPKLIDALATAITSIPPEALSKAVNSFTGIVEGAAEGAQEIVGWLIDSLTTSLNDEAINPEKITAMGNAIGEFIGSTISNIATSLPEIIPDLFTVGVNLAGSIVEGLFSGLIGTDDGLDAAFKDADKEMLQAIKDAERSAAEAHGIVDYMQELVNKYGEAAKNTDEWAKATERLQTVMPNANESLLIQNGTLSSNVDYLQREIDLIKERAEAQARQQALESKKQAYYDAVAELADAQINRNIEQDIIDSARENMIQLATAVGGLSRENAEKMDLNRLFETARSNLEYIELPEGKSYDEAFSELKGWKETVETSETAVKNLDSTIESLQGQVDRAKIVYDFANQALSDLAGSATTASGALANLREPAGKSNVYYTPHATGLDYVPYDGYKASLHRGEAVLTAKEASRLRDGGGNGDVVAAIQEMRNDLQNLRLVVGTKTFGRAVVNYGGRRMDGYIGQSESQEASGYGS